MLHSTTTARLTGASIRCGWRGMDERVRRRSAAAGGAGPRSRSAAAGGARMRRRSANAGGARMRRRSANAGGARMSAPPENQVRERVMSEVLRLAPRPLERVDAATDLEDELGFDSLALVELALALEQEFDMPPLSEGEAPETRTVRAVH